MTKQEIIECIAESVEVEPEEINEDTVMADLENWDSVAVLSVIAVINEKFNRFPSAADILACKTIKDLMAVFHE